jgi:tetratricopeptide (TPR) repeat protein
MNCLIARSSNCRFVRRSSSDGAHPPSRGLLRDLAPALVAVGLVLSAGCANTPAKPNQAVPFEAQPPVGTNHQTPDSSRARAGTDKHTSETSVLAKSFEDAVSRGDAAWNAGQTDMAIYLYIQALSFRPRDVNTLGKIGSIEQAGGDLVLAARAFELAATADPSDARLSGRLGLIQLALGDEEKARTWLQGSVDSGNTDWRVLDALGVIESHEGHSSEALRYSGEAVALAPGRATPLLHRGQAMFSSGDYIGAEDAARMTLRLGNVPDAWRLLGQIQAKRRSYSASIDSLLQALDAPVAYDTVGKLAMDNGDNAVALQYFNKASAVSPVYLVEVQRNAAIARERLGALKQ